MEYTLWINLLLLVFIFPLKSESSIDDSSLEEDEDESENDSTKNTTESVITVRKTDQATTMTIQTRSDGMEMAQSGQDGFKDQRKETNIAVMVGVPIALLGLVIVLGIIRLVSSGQLKNRVLGLGRNFGKIPEKSIPLYTANGSSSGNVTNKTIFNPTYAMQSGHASILSERKPSAGYGLDNMEQRVYVYDNPEVFKNDSDSTYQTITDGQFDPSFTDFSRFNGQPPAIPQRHYGETAYDNYI